MTAKVQPSNLPQSITTSLNTLRQLNTLNIQSSWQIWAEDSHDTSLFDTANKPTQTWPIAQLNDQGHIAWPKGLNVIWLHQSITIPPDLNGYPLTGLILRIALTWWAEDAQIYIDGNLAQSGDLFECFTRLRLCKHATPGQTFEFAIRLVSPGHDDGALVRSHLIYELPKNQPVPEPSFIADELAVLAILEPDHQKDIQSAVSQLDWASLTSKPSYQNADELWQNLSSTPSLPLAAVHPFQQSLSHLRRTLLPLSNKIKQRTIHCVGHAHLDMAWLWPIEDTWKAAERTFISILDLQKDFIELTYTHSSPALFEWIENNKPELFSQIQQKVKEGSWSIDAGLWIEPEFNIISGEAIARQILYGQQYCQEKFGTISKIAWLPDSFGFCWQLPQLLIQGGIETFTTLKLSWNDTTTFPHQLFWWESPDGSRILSLMLPPIGTDIDPVKMVNHASQWENATGLQASLWLPGLGDHGGGPTRDMLEKSQRWQQSPFFPTLNFTSPKKYTNNLLSPLTKTLPIWKDELYLELHRGCYTTHSSQKRQNRRCEDLLYTAEVFATVAYLTANKPYPKADIDTAWKKLLFNQFHDILPGTSIPEVFLDANRDWMQVQDIGKKVLQESLEAIAKQISRPNPPHPNAQLIIVFNPLSWSRHSVITHCIPESSPGVLSSNWKVQDESGQNVSQQTDFTTHSEQASCQLSFLAKDIPAVGYRCFWIYPDEHKASNTIPNQATHPHTLENEYLKATISSTTGQITSLIEKTTQTETFNKPGNQLQTFTDKGQYWDAWNIDPDYAKNPLPAPELLSIQWFEKGSIRQRIRTTHKFQNSTIIQYYTLEAKSPYLKVETHIDWKESQVLLKVVYFE